MPEWQARGLFHRLSVMKKARGARLERLYRVLRGVINSDCPGRRAGQWHKNEM